ncbi:hypothetical protein [Ruegeria sp.]|uniref:hypothetical protein n=1 Tax=Ruegeria sp. TaxID=1879320 RepID=UPI003B5BD2D7
MNRTPQAPDTLPSERHRQAQPRGQLLPWLRGGPDVGRGDAIYQSGRFHLFEVDFGRWGLLIENVNRDRDHHLDLSSEFHPGGDLFLRNFTDNPHLFWVSVAGSPLLDGTRPPAPPLLRYGEHYHGRLEIMLPKDDGYIIHLVDDIDLPDDSWLTLPELNGESWTVGYLRLVRRPRPKDRSQRFEIVEARPADGPLLHSQDAPSGPQAHDRTGSE